MIIRDMDVIAALTSSEPKWKMALERHSPSFYRKMAILMFKASRLKEGKPVIDSEITLTKAGQEELSKIHSLLDMVFGSAYFACKENLPRLSLADLELWIEQNRKYPGNIEHYAIGALTNTNPRLSTTFQELAKDMELHPFSKFVLHLLISVLFSKLPEKASATPMMKMIEFLTRTKPNAHLN